MFACESLRAIPKPVVRLDGKAFRLVVPKCARQLHRRAVLGRKRLLLTPAAVCASPQGGRKTAIAPILTKKQLFRTAAWGLPKCSLAKLYLSDSVLGSFAPAGATRACAALDLRPGSPGGHNLWDRLLRLPAGGRCILGPPDCLPSLSRSTQARCHFTPWGVSSSRIPRAFRSSRILSARAKSFSPRACCRRAIKASISSSRLPLPPRL